MNRKTLLSILPMRVLSWLSLPNLRSCLSKL